MKNKPKRNHTESIGESMCKSKPIEIVNDTNSTLKVSIVDEKNKFQSFTIILSTILSVLSLLISASTFGYTIWKDSQNDLESLSLVVSDYGYSDVMEYRMNGGYRGQGKIGGVTYTITVSNTSKHTVSIISYELCRIIDKTRFMYGDIITGIVDSEKNPVTFPIVLAAGEAKRISLVLNHLVTPSINMLLLEKFGPEAQLTYDEIRDYLGENGRDLFGNEVEYYKYEDGTYLMKMDNPHFPVFQLQLLTSKGNHFEIEITQ